MKLFSRVGLSRTQMPTTTPASQAIPKTWLNGCNVGGVTQFWQTQLPFVNGTNGKIIVQADVDYLVSKGINSVRYMLSQEFVQSNQSSNNQKFSVFHAANWAAFKASIKLFTDANIYVIIARHQGLDQNFGCFEDVPYEAYGGANSGFALADFWFRIAEQFVGNSLIAYDLDNEPLLGNSGMWNWWKIAQDCIDAIRRAGAGQTIFINGISYSGSSQWNSTPWNNPGGLNNNTNATQFLTLTDPCNNLVSETHSYMSAADSGTNTDVLNGTIGRTRLANVVTWANTNNQLHLVGEWANRPDVTNGAANISDFTAYLKSVSPPKSGKIVGGLWWTYASYPFFNGYQFTLTTVGAAPPGGTDSVCMDGLEAVNYFTLPVAFDPNVDAPNIYGNWQASNWNGSYIDDSSGLGADLTKRMYGITTAGWTSPTYTASDSQFNNNASIGTTAGGTYTGLVNNATLASATNLATSISGAATVYGVYWVVSPPASSCFLRQSRAMSGTTLASPGLWYFGNYQSSRDNTNNVGGAVGASAGKLVVVCNVYNGASSATYVNTYNTTLATGNAGTTTITSLGFGNAASQPALWRMGETLIYTSAHNSTNRQNVMQYLGAKYGVTITA